jgi:hypothetical protein
MKDTVLTTIHINVKENIKQSHLPVAEGLKTEKFG